METIMYKKEIKRSVGTMLTTLTRTASAIIVLSLVACSGGGSDDGGGGGGKGAWARHSNQPAGGQVVVPVGTGRRPGLLRALDVSM